MFRYVLASCFVLAIAGCGEDPQSPESESSLSGSVVFEETGSPAAGIDVVLERMAGAMMMGDRWDQTEHILTNDHGQFHFEYMHEPMRRYRVGVRGRSEWHMCDWEPSDEDSIVIVISRQSQ